jgi:hypothetical protein
MLGPSLTRPLVVLGIALVLAACSGAAKAPPPNDGGGAASAGPSVAAPTQPSTAAGANGFEGTLISSGQYAATWKVAPDAEVEPFNAVGNATLTSDKGTYGNLAVKPDGTVSFGSAAAELTNIVYNGTGAKVTLDSSSQFVCAFTFDGDLKGTRDGAILHMAGGMTVHWHPTGIGDLNCP